MSIDYEKEAADLLARLKLADRLTSYHHTASEAITTITRPRNCVIVLGRTGLAPRPAGYTATARHNFSTSRAGGTA